LPTPTELEFALGAGSSESYFWMDCDEEGNSRIPESLVRVSRPAYIALSLSDPAPDEEGRIVEFNRGQVDPVSEHILLKYGDISKNSWKECRSVARIGKPVQGKITVQFLIDVADGSNFDLVKTVVGQMKNYLVVRGRSRPWRYAHHHCGTSANVYSDLHWSVVNGAIFDNNSCEE